MNKYILILVIALFFFNATKAQTNLAVFFKDTNTTKNAIGLGFTYESTLYIGLGYDRIIKVKNKNVNLGVEISTPILLLASRTKKIALNGSVYLLKSNFNVRTHLGINANFYDDAIAKGHFMDIRVGLFPGYYRTKFFVAAELSYKNNLFTSFNFKNNSINQDNIVLANTTGNFTFGVNGGFLVAKRLELKAKIFYNMSRNFKNYAPYTQNIGVNLGLNYKF